MSQPEEIQNSNSQSTEPVTSEVYEGNFQLAAVETLTSDERPKESPKSLAQAVENFSRFTGLKGRLVDKHEVVAKDVNATLTQSALKGRIFQIGNQASSNQRFVTDMADPLWSPLALEPNFKKKFADIVSRARSKFPQESYDSAEDDPKSILSEKTSPWRAAHLITMGNSKTPWICASDTEIIFYRSDGKISVLHWLNGDFSSMEGERLLEKESLIKVNRNANVYGVIFTGSSQKRSILCMLIKEIESNIWWLVFFDVNSGMYKANLVVEHLLNVPKEAGENDCYARIFCGENDEIICIFWDVEENEDCELKHTLNIYSVIKLKISETEKVSLETLLANKKIDGKWFQPSVSNTALYFVIDSEHLSTRYEFLKVPFDETEEEVFYMTPLTTPQTLCPRFLTWSQACHINNHSLFYNFNEARKIGLLYALDIIGKVWKKVLELSRHAVIENCSIAVTPNKEMLYLNGKCAERDCPDGSHLYKFPIGGLFQQVNSLKNFVCLTVEQIWAINIPQIYPTAIEIIHGPTNSGKSTVIKLKFLEVIKNGDNALLYLSRSNKQAAQEYFSNLKEGIFNAEDQKNHVRNFSDLENDMLTGENSKSVIFIDSLPTLNYKHKSWLLKRQSTNMKTVIALDITIKHTHWREGLTMIKLSQLHTSEQLKEEADTSEENMKKNKNKKSSGDNTVEHFEKACEYAMDKYFNGWRNETFLENEFSACIPACSDTGKGRYLRPTDVKASGYNTESIEKHSSSITGHHSENKVLNALRNAKLGGFLIGNFDIKDLQDSLKTLGNKSPGYKHILTMLKFRKRRHYPAPKDWHLFDRNQRNRKYHKWR